MNKKRNKKKMRQIWTYPAHADLDICSSYVFFSRMIQVYCHYSIQCTCQVFFQCFPNEVIYVDIPMSTSFLFSIPELYLFIFQKFSGKNLSVYNNLQNVFLFVFSRSELFLKRGKKCTCQAFFSYKRKIFVFVL